MPARRMWAKVHAHVAAGSSVSCRRTLDDSRRSPDAVLQISLDASIPLVFRRICALGNRQEMQDESMRNVHATLLIFLFFIYFGAIFINDLFLENLCVRKERKKH